MERPWFLEGLRSRTPAIGLCDVRRPCGFHSSRCCSRSCTNLMHWPDYRLLRNGVQPEVMPKYEAPRCHHKRIGREFRENGVMFLVSTTLMTAVVSVNKQARGRHDTTYHRLSSSLKIFNSTQEMNMITWVNSANIDLGSPLRSQIKVSRKQWPRQGMLLG